MKALAPARKRALFRALLLSQLVLVPVGLAVLLYLLVDRLPFVELWEAATAVAASFALALLGYSLFAVRLVYVLKAFGLRLPLASIWRIHLTSVFYYFFLPAGIGYDFSKIAKITRQLPERSTWKVTAAAAADRATGGVGMYLLLLVTLPLTHLAPDSRLEWLTPPGWGWALLAAVVPVGCAATAYWGRRSGAYRSRPLVSAVLASAICYLLVAGAIWVVARSLGIPIIFPEVVVALAATLLLQLVPVNVLGVTLGEVAAVTVYLAYGLDEPQALLMVTVAYTHRLVSAMLGGLMEWRGALRALRAPEGDAPTPTSGGMR